jgi:hypothetical protein
MNQVCGCDGRGATRLARDASTRCCDASGNLLARLSELRCGPDRERHHTVSGRSHHSDTCGIARAPLLERLARRHRPAAPSGVSVMAILYDWVQEMSRRFDALVKDWYQPTRQPRRLYGRGWSDIGRLGFRIVRNGLGILCSNPNGCRAARDRVVANGPYEPPCRLHPRALWILMRQAFPRNRPSGPPELPDLLRNTFEIWPR